MTTPADTFSYTFDAAGRPTGLTNPFSKSFSWSYLNNDWLSAQTKGSSATSVYSYNPLGKCRSDPLRTGDTSDPDLRTQSGD